MKRRYLLLCAAICLVFILCSCKSSSTAAEDEGTSKPTMTEIDTVAGTKPEDSETETKLEDGEKKEPIEPTKELEPTDASMEVTPAPTVDAALNPLENSNSVLAGKDAWYQEAVKKSLVSAGNNYRVKKVIEKAKSGQEINIVFIGGSITEGANAMPYSKCYVQRFCDWFGNTYASDNTANIHVKNSGIGGTSSPIGMVRYERDVEHAFDGAPDLVVIEFAVNDYMEPTNQEAYESMIRTALSSENQPAVLLLFGVFKSQWNMQELYIPLGNYYELPMVSILDGVVPAIKNGELKENTFFSDIYHPTNYGHQLMSDCISYLFEEVEAQEAAKEDITVKEVKIGNAYEGMKLLTSATENEEIKIDAGDFSLIDKSMPTIKCAPSQLIFPENWKHGKDCGTTPLSVTLECKNMMLLYKKSNSDSAGAVDVYLDGAKLLNISCHDPNGWNNTEIAVLFKAEETKKHKIEFKMADDSTDKEFTILGLGYTK